MYGCCTREVYAHIVNALNCVEQKNYDLPLVEPIRRVYIILVQLHMKYLHGVGRF